jgi:methionyl-tRNA formyltransferase
MKYRIIIVTRGISEIVEPVVHSEVADVVGIIEAKHPSELVDPGEISTLGIYASQAGIPFLSFPQSTEILADRVRALEPDLILIYQMPRLLKKEIFSIPRFGAINLHPSLLPSYRGPNPWFWTYYNMETEGGVTVHFIDEREDTGDIIYQSAFDIPLGATLKEMTEKAIGKIGVDLILKSITNIENLTPVKQPLLSPTERAVVVHDFHNIIDFKNWKIERVWHLLRGFPLLLTGLPLDGINIQVPAWEVLGFQKTEPAEKNRPGSIISIGEKSFLVCHDGIINLMPAR